MSEICPAPHHFAYLFERFPTFTQTFCVREVQAMRDLGLEFPVYSIRKPTDEPAQDCFRGCCGVTFLPAKYDDILASDVGFRRAARKALDTLRCLWGSEHEKKRIYEALWLGPKLRQADVRHVHVHFAGTAARTAFWLNKLFGIRYSITAHANDIFCDEPPERLAQIFAAASVVVTVSDYRLDFLKRNYPAQSAKFFRVYNGIATDRFAVSEFPAGRPVIVSVGRYIEKKGFGTLVEACSHLRDRDWECQIIGQGPLETELKEQVSRLGLEGRVFIAGPRCEGEIRGLLSRAHIFALPCLKAADGGLDNLPTVIMEAMAAGLPAVSTPIAAVPEMVVDGKTGFLTPEKDPAAMAGKIARLLDDGALAKTLGAAARERCLDLFDLRRTSSALCQILKDHDAIANRSGCLPALQSTAA
jgi:colanic acid/amylovoran biosynthesis glycosyltransferase